MKLLLLLLMVTLLYSPSSVGQLFSNCWHGFYNGHGDVFVSSPGKSYSSIPATCVVEVVSPDIVAVTVYLALTPSQRLEIPSDMFDCESSVHGPGVHVHQVHVTSLSVFLGDDTCTFSTGTFLRSWTLHLNASSIDGILNIAKMPDPNTLQSYGSVSFMVERDSLRKYAISGWVRTSGGDPIPGVLLDGLPQAANSVGDGSFSGMVYYGWSGFAVPRLQNYTFTPDSLRYPNTFAPGTTQPDTFVVRNQNAVVVVGTPSSGVPVRADRPLRTVLVGNYPNPFNPATVIEYEVAEQTHVVLTILNPLGQTVRSLVDAKKNPGRHCETFDARELPTGVYFSRLQAGGFVATQKLLLLR